jgi:hypothetical protein
MIENLMAAMKTLIAMAVVGCYGKTMVLIEIQFLKWK